MSKIYLVTRDITKSNVTYDVYNHHVIIAKTPTEAKELALDVAADEGEVSWVEAKCEIIGTPKDPTSRIILSDFNAG